LDHLVEQARAGDETVLPQLQRVLDDHREIWQHFANLAGHVQGEWVKLLAGSDLVVRESLLRRAQAMRAELEGPGPSRLERLLCDAIVTTWLEAEYFAILLVSSGDKGTPRQIESLHLRRDAAHRRHLAAVKSLAETRRLLGTATSGEPAPIGSVSTISRASTNAGHAMTTGNLPRRKTIPMKARRRG
jgi:hypothetical protein